MSGNGGRCPSQREKDVIEQQRRLAERFGKKQTPQAPSQQRPTTTIKAGGLTLKAAPPSKRPSAADVSKKHATQAALANLSRVNNKAGPAQKRPTRPNLKRPSSAATVLAAARAKAAARNGGRNPSIALPDTKPSVTKAEITSSPANVAAEAARVTESPKLKRKIKSVEASKANSLANLVENVAFKEKTAGGDSLASASFASNIAPDDLWKNIREWDFVSDLARQQQQQQELDDTVKTPAKKSIPDTFISSRHYIAAWAPLCLAETRAQLLSEVLTECGQNPRRSPFLLVDVETTWKGGKKDRALHTELMDIDSCNVQLKMKHRGNEGKLQFYAHDFCCLVPVQHKDMVERLLRGGQIHNHEDSFRKFGMIGHTEVQRKEVNGLILKVSKRKWAQIGCSQMFLLRIGGNITALREFTALCRVEAIPLKRYLLGSHLEKTEKTTSDFQKTAHLSNQKEALLKKMGGVQALGKGFTEYAQRKFNPSQLMAISASAHGYGDGGFTLIKGPPGTGSKCEIFRLQC
jgi:senataxin